MAIQSGARLKTAPITHAGARALHRALGTVGMLTSPFLFLSFAANGFAEGDSNKLGAALGLLFTAGWLCNVIGLRRLHAAGRSTAAGSLLGLQLVTVSLAAIFQVYEFLAPGSDSVLYHITDIAWPLSMLLLLITGIVAARVGAFQGWLRFTPLIAALWLPLGILEMALLGQTVGSAVGGLHTVAGWFLIGYAVRRGGRLTENA